MAFTKRHYNEVARIIREGREYEGENADDMESSYDRGYTAGFIDAYREAQGRLARMFAADNPKFDGARFDMNCEPREGGK